MLETFTYHSTSQDPTSNSATSRTISWIVTDANSQNTGGGALPSSAATSTINIIAEIDPPIVSAINTLAYAVSSGQSIIDNTISISDIDDSHISGATMSLPTKTKRKKAMIKIAKNN